MKTIFFEKINWKIKNFSNQKLPDWRYKIIEVKNNRTLEQNKLYYSWFFASFLPKKKIKSDFSNKYVFALTSTTELNTKQFTNYIENIKIICEFGKLNQIKELEKIEWFLINEKDENF